MQRHLMFLILTAILILGYGQNAQAMFFFNGDFENGDLNHWNIQEDFADVVSSPLVNAVDDGTGNHVGELNTGFTGDGVTNTLLVRDIGTMPLTAQDLFFDFKVLDAGPDVGGGSSFVDLLTISLLTDSGDLNPILTADTAGYSIINPALTNITFLPNGFYRVETDVVGLQGANNAKLYFDLFDDDDARLTKAWIDNLDLTVNPVPEPVTLMMFGAGLIGFVGSRRKGRA